jgi:dynein heavy chain
MDNKLICYVEDLHMSWTDAYGDQPAIEAIRDYLTVQAWFSSRKKRWRELEDVSFFACMASNAPETARVSGRVLHQFNLISLDEPKADTMRSMFSSLTELMVINWPSAIQMYSSNIVEAIIDISLKVFERFKPTPMKAHYTFNWRDTRKVLLSMQMIEANSLKKQVNVMKLLYHECYRNFGDRILMVHDKRWFAETLKKVCSEHFYVVEQLEVFESPESPKKGSKEGQPAEDEKEGKGAANAATDELDPKRKDQFLWPIADPDQLFFSKWNQEVEGFYMEVDRIDEIDKVIEANLERYNDSNERVRLDLILFNQLNRLMLKILRVISTPSGHLINVAMKGFGMNSVIKLVAFAAAHQLREFEVFEGFQHDEWHAELRRAVTYCASEGKPLTFFVDEYKMVRDQMYTDLECLLKNHMASEIMRKPDVMMTLVELYEQIEADKEASKVALAGDDVKNQSGEAKAE